MAEHEPGSSSRQSDFRDILDQATNEAAHHARVRAESEEIHAAAGQGVQSYFIAADLLYVSKSWPTRYFGTSSSGTIFQSTARVAAFYSGSPAAPAKPIQ